MTVIITFPHWAICSLRLLNRPGYYKNFFHAQHNLALNLPYSMLKCRQSLVLVIMLINVKMSTIVDILTFISMVNNC